MASTRKAWTRKAQMLVLAAALAGAGSPAHALDIDLIEVQSGLGEPLRAQIAVVSSDPAELASLQAQLASSATFARAGLARPQGAVADLRFAVAKDARGRTVIRITSSAPVREDFFTFLISLDWNGGHLVREYSVSLANPGTLNATAAPLIQAPVAAPSNAIVRAPELAPAPGAAPIPLVGQAPASLPAPTPVPLQATVPPPVPSRARERVADNAIPAPPKPKPAATPKPAPKADTAAKPKPEVKPEPKPAAAAPTKPAPAAKPVAKAAPARAADAKPASGATEQVKAGDTLTRIAARMDGAGHTRDQMMLALLRSNPDAFIGGNINRIRQGAELRAPDAAELSRFGAAEASVMVRDQIAQWRGGQSTMPQPVALAGDTPRPASADRQAPATPAAPRPQVAAARLEIVPAAAAGAGAAGSRSGIGAGQGEMLRRELQEHDETLASRDVEIAELKKRLAGLEKLQQDQQKLIALQSSELAAAQQRSADAQKRAPAQDRAPVWPWLLGALAILGALVWLVTRRRAPTPSGLFEDKAPAATAPPAAPAAAPAADLTAGFPTWHAGAEDEAAEAGAMSEGAKRLQIARAYLDLGDLGAARRVLREVAAGSDAAARDTASGLLREID
jgi:pilus assembly protein FimV